MEDNLLYQVIGTRIRKYRESQKVSEKEFAERLGMSEERILLIESGNYTLDIISFVKIADALKIEASRLCEICFDAIELNSEFSHYKYIRSRCAVLIRD